LTKLLALAEQTELYLDLTGLGCYHKADVPDWYDTLKEADRWRAQGVFWEAVAQRCADSPAIFCYDLMNEPVAPAGKKRADDWLGPAFGDKHFVQRIGLELGDRERTEVATAWIDQLVAAIRKHDQDHLVTVGLVPWSLKRPGLQSGFEPEVVTGSLDFVAVHLYPEAGKLDEALETLRGFDVGKPVVIEETFTLKCGGDQLRDFIRQSRGVADGWIGFYWGVTPAEYAEEKSLPAAITMSWLTLFQELGPEMSRPTAEAQ
ncbi:MAG: cellulase family glycosylhydrolase, partial [Planctomycetaceae bacterium]|nr:cellulase family glycosylhydrolase [Planctomycetaceae bacterium]